MFVCKRRTMQSFATPPGSTAVSSSVLESSEWPAFLLSSLEMLWRDSALCDVTFDSSHGAHACVLAAASPVLRAAAGRRGGLKTAAEMAVPSSVWPVLLRFVYGGVLRVRDAAEATRVLHAAEQLQITKLRTLCSEFLRINPDTSVTIKEEPPDWLYDDASCCQTTTQSEILSPRSDGVSQHGDVLIDKPGSVSVVGEIDYLPSQTLKGEDGLLDTHGRLGWYQEPSLCHEPRWSPQDWQQQQQQQQEDGGMFAQPQLHVQQQQQRLKQQQELLSKTDDFTARFREHVSQSNPQQRLYQHLQKRRASQDGERPAAWKNLWFQKLQLKYLDSGEKRPAEDVVVNEVSEGDGGPCPSMRERIALEAITQLAAGDVSHGKSTTRHYPPPTSRDTAMLPEDLSVHRGPKSSLESLLQSKSMLPVSVAISSSSSSSSNEVDLMATRGINEASAVYQTSSVASQGEDATFATTPSGGMQCNYPICSESTTRPFMHTTYCNSATKSCPATTKRLWKDKAVEERQLMRPWLMEKLNEGKVSGLYWLDAEKTLARVPWLHASRTSWDMLKDASLFKLWAVHTGKYIEGRDEPDPKRWKANFRCALNSLCDVVEVKDRSFKRGNDAYKVYTFAPAVKKRRKQVTSLSSNTSSSSVDIGPAPNRTVTQALNVMSNQTVNHTAPCAGNQDVYAVSNDIMHTTNQTVFASACATNQTVNQSIACTIDQAINQAVSQAASKAVNQQVSETGTPTWMYRTSPAIVHTTTPDGNGQLPNWTANSDETNHKIDNKTDGCLDLRCTISDVANGFAVGQRLSGENVASHDGSCDFRKAPSISCQ